MTSGEPNQATIKRVANGYVVSGAPVYDAGDGIPWPYQHEWVCETFEGVVAKLVVIFGLPTPDAEEAMR